jgi:hypothetical protein
MPGLFEPERPTMKKVRFHDLREQGIVNNWPQLRNLIRKYGFPAGHMLSPNCRVWDQEDEVEPWLASRPTAGPAPRGAAKAGRGRPRKAEMAARKAAKAAKPDTATTATT